MLESRILSGYKELKIDTEYPLASFRNDLLARQVRNSDRGSELRVRLDEIFLSGQLLIHSSALTIIADVAFLCSISNQHCIYFTVAGDLQEGEVILLLRRVFRKIKFSKDDIY